MIWLLRGDLIFDAVMYAIKIIAIFIQYSTNNKRVRQDLVGNA